MTKPVKPSKKQAKKDFKQILSELGEQKLRYGKEALTTEERQAICDKIYDTALVSLEMAVMQGINTGTLAAVHIMERTRIEHAELGRAREEQNNQNTPDVIVWAEAPNHEHVQA